ncbi:MAG TPA: histidine kinase [Pyrinomonadaceae bacterium]|nr:histidine kinase [Pyrinomonadaceae bacterium]
MRLILAASALFIIYIDPSEPDRLAPITYGALVLYVIYSLILYVISLLQSAESRSLPAWAPWIDVCWYVFLIALSSGTNSIFFFFFFFPILVSSFSSGFASGLRLTIASAVLFTIVGYLTAPSEPHFQLNRFLLRPVYLLVLGYMISYWGGYEVKLKKRLKFLRDISAFSNPRFGIDHTVNWMMERVRSFYDADTVLLIVFGEKEKAYTLRRVDRENDSSTSFGKVVGDEVAAIFVSLQSGEAMMSHGSGSENFLYNVLTGELTKDERPHDVLVNALESKKFLTVPINYRSRGIGRCYIIGGPSKYSASDIEFVLQAIDQVIPVIDNIRLVDHLASDAAERERDKIARDIHDSLIQPYIGFQLGLAAVVQKLERGDADVTERINELSDLTAKGIADLRHYIRGMKETERDQNTLLLPAVRRFASKFQEATGIQVVVEASDTLNLNDRLAGEVFQMINEGLSNIRRHSNAQSARAELIQVDGKLILKIENETLDGEAKALFHPRSLAERAAALGGDLTVENAANKSTVTIQIPL